MKIRAEKAHPKIQTMKGVILNEIGREYFDKESVLYGRKEDHGVGTYAAFCGVRSAEGFCVYQFLEQCKPYKFLCTWIY